MSLPLRVSPIGSDRFSNIRHASLIHNSPPLPIELNSTIEHPPANRIGTGTLDETPEESSSTRENEHCPSYRAQHGRQTNIRQPVKRCRETRTRACTDNSIRTMNDVLPTEARQQRTAAVARKTRRRDDGTIEELSRARSRGVRRGGASRMSGGSSPSSGTVVVER